MPKTPLAPQRHGADGFTTTEIIVAIAVITAMSTAAFAFFSGRQDLARRQIVVSQLAEAILTVHHLPRGNDLTWQATAQNLVADVLELDPPTSIYGEGQRARLIPDGLHVGRTRIAERALLTDSQNGSVDLLGCDIGDLQMTLTPSQLPPEHVLRDVDLPWLRRNLGATHPDLIIAVREFALFSCLPSP